GRVVLNQSDLLIVVWDGAGENKRGGTYETMKEASAFNVPVLWIDARAPHDWQLLELESDLPACCDERCMPRNKGPLDLARIVNRVLEPPNTGPKEDGSQTQTPDLRAAYFAERKPGWNRWFVWKFFRDLVGSFRFRVPKLRV